MKTFSPVLLMLLFFLGCFSDISAQNTKSLPEGYGLSDKYPADRGIAKDRDVLLFEDFEEGTIQDLSKRWENVSNKNGEVLEFIDDTPVGGAGKRSLKMTATLGQNTGGHLYKRLPKQVDTAFVRFYVKFPKDAAYIHHFVHFGGYNPSTPWPQGGAGERPRGDERITVGIEPYGSYGKYPPPGAWNLYCYWHEMKGSADGRFWGNSLMPANPAIVKPDKWECVEVMLKLNSTPDEADGELAIWIDGKLNGYFKKGTARSQWTGMGFRLLDSGGEPFEGFRWRKSTDLKINFFWLLHYVTENAYRQNRVANPPQKNSVMFDNIVVATKYIGPIKPLK